MNAIVAALDLTSHSADRMHGDMVWNPVALASRVGLLRGTERQALDETLALLAEARETIAQQQERIAYLESLTMTDELTGLLNRRGFYSHFRRELATARRTGVGGLLVMIDLDGFKAINDTHGHLAGDSYLRQVAVMIASSVRQEDVVARLGGDEFAVLLTNTDVANGLARARELAGLADACHAEWGGVALSVRFSVGTQPYGAEDDREDEVMRRADTMMYGAKCARRQEAKRKTKPAADPAGAEL